MNVHEFAELAAGHALNALSPDDERAFQAALAEHPEWAGIVEADADTAAVLAEGVGDVAPPPAARATILAMIAGDAESGSPVSAVTDSAADRHVADHRIALSAPIVVDTGEAVEGASQPVEDVATLIPASPDAESRDAESRDAESRDAASPDAATIASESPAESAEPTEAPPAAAPAPPTDDLAAILGEPPSTEMIQTVQRRNWTRGVLALAASIVLLVALGFGAAYIGDLVAPKSVAVVALQEIEAAPDAQSVVGEAGDGGTVTAHWAASLGKAVVVTDGLPVLASGEVYQAWFVRGDTPVAAGVLETDGDGSGSMLLTTEMHADDVIALTIEPTGGSEAPTSDPVVAIPTA